MNRLTAIVSLILLLMVVIAVAAPAIETVPIKNPNFTEGVADNGIPNGFPNFLWTPATHAKLIDYKGARVLLIDDSDPKTEVGIVQGFPLKPDIAYEARISVHAIP